MYIAKNALGVYIEIYACNGPRVARFFLVQHTKTGKYIPNRHKIYQMATKYAKRTYKRSNDHKIYQHIPLQVPPKFIQIMICGLKIWHLATLRSAL
jgi:hypothetical protein